MFIALVFTATLAVQVALYCTALHFGRKHVAARKRAERVMIRAFNQSGERYVAPQNKIGVN